MPRTIIERQSEWEEERMRRQARRFRSGRGKHPARKPKAKK